MKRKIFTLLACAVVAVGTASAAKNITITKTATAPVLDGVLEDAVWKDVPAQVLDQKKGTEDAAFSAEFKMVYDATNIYVAVKKNDPDPKTDGASTWQSDCVELFFAIDTTGQPRSYTNGETNAFQLRKLDSKAQADGGFEGGGALTTDVVKVEQDGDATIVQEWSIPWAELTADYADWTGKAGSTFMFDVQAAQAKTTATGREYQLFWNSNADNQYNTVQNQGLITIKDALTTAVASANVAKASAYVAGSFLKVKNVNGMVNVYDLTGKLVAKSNVNGSASINISALKAGMYIVSGNGLSAKIVK